MDEETAENILKTADWKAARRMVLAIADELDGLAAQVWAFGGAEGARRAFAIVAQIGTELLVGACHLYKRQRWYAGAALVRQLIEVEYLLFLFATDKDEPQRWLKASDVDAKNMFAPSQMRRRAQGRFDVSEYQTHCKIGGHPRVSGHVLLKEHITPITTTPLKLFDPSIQWVDLAQHVERFLAHYIAAVAIHSPSNVYVDRFAKLVQAVSDWRSTETNPNVHRI
jgi:hypothetical protein